MDALAELLGASPGMIAVRDAVSRLLVRRADGRRLPPVLIRGETGTGKGLLARALHRSGPRAAGPFVDVNCAAIPDTLLEAEMFGVERGAFTDARESKPGLFRTAHRGTLFLDEIGLLPIGLQVKLLSAIEDQRVRRLGATRSEPVDVWIIAATNEDLAAAIRDGRFREDLYHRLSVIVLALPPLRERGDDVMQLAEHFLTRACAEYDLPAKVFTPGARAALLSQAWPGNVRELANAMERVALLSDARAITADVLGMPAPAAAAAPSPETSLRDAVQHVERERLLQVLLETKWNVSRTAVRLGISRNTLRQRIQKLGLRSHEGPHEVQPPRSEAPVAKPPPVPVHGPAPAPTRPVPAAAPPPTSIRWERRRLTLLYAALATPQGPATFVDTSRALDVCVQKVDSFAGRIEELGQGTVMAVFGLDPLEDAADRAALTAMALHKVARRGADATAPRPEVVVALHTAPFLVGHMGDRTELEASGKREARGELEALIAKAVPGATLTSAACARLLERRFDLESTGVAQGDGRATYRLLGRERAGFGRRLGRFVGRREELALLGSRLEATRLGQGQVVAIRSGAGMGKSRLLFEFRQGLVGGDVTYLEGRCASYWSGFPYLPVIDLLRAGFRLGDTDPPGTVARKVRFGLRQLGLDPREAAPYVLRLLGAKEAEDEISALSPEALNVRTLQTLRHMSRQSSQRRPLVLAVEDVQWIDSASAAFLASLVDSLAGARILVVVTCRSGHGMPWAERSYATHLSLSALDHAGSRAVLESSWPPGGIAAEVERTILVKAEGNPFFLEELARAVSDQDPRDGVRIPDTVEEVLLARMERLSGPLRQILRAAAVLGREVSPRLLGLMCDQRAELDEHLGELVRFEFIHEVTASPESSYVFTHTLTREVAYASLVPEERQRLHEAAGRALEALHEGRLDEIADRLAHHYTRTSLATPAVEYASIAAGQAARSYAHHEAVGLLEEAIAHADRLPASQRDRRFAELTLRQVESLSFLGRFSEALDRLLAAQRRIEAIGDNALGGQLQFWLGHTYSYLGRGPQAVDSARQAIAAAEPAGDAATVGKALALLAQECSWSGQPAAGVEHGQRAIAILERTGEQWWQGLANWIVGINHITAGDFEHALEAVARARIAGEAIGDPRIQSYAAWTTGWIHALRGEADTAIDICQRALAASLDPVNTAVVTAHLGHAHLEKGDLVSAIPLLEEAVAMMSQFRFRRLQGRALTFLGEGYLASGRLDQARQVVQEGLELTREARYGYGLGWAQWVSGRIAVASGRPDEARRELEEALGTFESIGARFMAARVHVTLAELAQTQGDRPHEVTRLFGEALDVFRALQLPLHEGKVLASARACGVVIR